MQLYSGNSAVVEGSCRTAVVEPARVDLVGHAASGNGELGSHYDLTLSHPEVHASQFNAFDNWLAAEAAGHGLSYCLIHDGNVGKIIGRLCSGEMTIGYHLDYYALWHRPLDVYARLAQAVEDAGGRSVNSPARARAFTDKAAAVCELVHHGLGVPGTVIVRPWSSVRPLSIGERYRVGVDQPGKCVYLKPANGFAGQGVVRIDGTDEALAGALTQARRQEPDETFLIQREVRPPQLMCEDGVARPAYWRVLFQMDELIPFWWSHQDRIGPAPSYRVLTAAEVQRHRLHGVLAYVRQLAALTGLEWFSTELCLSDANEASCHSVPGPDGRELPVVAIDPINDQCDVEVQSRWPGAAPDDAVRRIAARFAERAWQCRQRALRPESVIAYRVAA